MNLIMSQYWTTFLNHHVSCSFLSYRNGTGLIVLTITGTLLKCQVHLALRHTNWGHCKLKLLQITKLVKCRFLRRRENQSAWGKTSQSREKNQQTQPMYVANSVN